jgi:hypothetical protein
MVIEYAGNGVWNPEALTVTSGSETIAAGQACLLLQASPPAVGWNPDRLIWQVRSIWVSLMTMGVNAPSVARKAA